MTSFRRSDAGMIRTAYELSAGMLSFVVALAIGWWFGRVLDAWLGTSPWLTLALSGFGLTAGILNVYRTVSHAMKSPPARPHSDGD
jgi:F0F1-type ATP synthase assembly protein I